MVRELDHRHIDRRIAALAGRRKGLVRHDQLGLLGMNDHAIEKRLQRGRLLVVRRGVYAVGHAHLTAEARSLAAVWACGPTAVLSHRSAGALWGIRPSSSPIIDVTVRSRTGRADRDGIRLHRVTRLSEDETTERDGIPVTSWARTILDLAAVLPPRGVELALGRSEQLRLFDLNQLDTSLIANSGQSGLPRPEVNVEIGTYTADFCGERSAWWPRPMAGRPTARAPPSRATASGTPS